MRNVLVGLILLLIGFLGGYVVKGYLVDSQENQTNIEKTSNEAVKPNGKANEKPVVQGEVSPKEESKVEVFSSDPKEAALQADFKVFKEASEGYLNSLTGQALSTNDYNTFLSADYKLYFDKNGILLSDKKDQWGNNYQVFINPKKEKIVVQSNGEGKGGYVLASYQQNTSIESCTRGFNEGGWALTTIHLKAGEACGGDL